MSQLYKKMKTKKAVSLYENGVLVTTAGKKLLKVIVDKHKVLHKKVYTSIKEACEEKGYKVTRMEILNKYMRAGFSVYEPKKKELMKVSDHEEFGIVFKIPKNKAKKVFGNKKEESLIDKIISKLDTFELDKTEVEWCKIRRFQDYLKEIKY